MGTSEKARQAGREGGREGGRVGERKKASEGHKSDESSELQQPPVLAAARASDAQTELVFSICEIHRSLATKQKRRLTYPQEGLLLQVVH